MHKTLFHFTGDTTTKDLVIGDYIWLRDEVGNKEDYIITGIIDSKTIIISQYTWYWKLWHLLTFRYVK
jgi:hypothetical protein